MRPGDVDRVVQIAAACYPDHPEDRAVFEERLRLYPDGCLVLDAGDAVDGYVLSYPWVADAAPPLNALIGVLPPRPAAYYLHDLAIMPNGRGGGHSRSALAKVAALAGKRPISLVSVNGTVPFWQRHGFAVHSTADLDSKLGSYGADARFMLRPADERAPQGRPG